MSTRIGFINCQKTGINPRIFHKVGQKLPVTAYDTEVRYRQAASGCRDALIKTFSSHENVSVSGLKCFACPQKMRNTINVVDIDGSDI